MKTKNALPRRRFLVGSTLAACALLVPRLQGKPGSIPAEPTVVLNDDDQAVIAELAAYSSAVYTWAGPTNFPLRETKVLPNATRSTRFLVLVNDFEKLALYLISENLARLGVVYTGGCHLAFVVGTTAYTVTNYGPRDFSHATR
jgi:hypothetical protein